MTTLPRILRPNSGLTRIGRTWYAVFKEDGVVRKFSLETQAVTIARKLRDTLFSEMEKQGAVRAVSGPRQRTVRPEGLQYVYYRKPWVVSIKGVHVGTYETEQEAVEARNRAHAAE